MLFLWCCHCSYFCHAKIVTDDPSADVVVVATTGAFFFAVVHEVGVDSLDVSGAAGVIAVAATVVIGVVYIIAVAVVVVVHVNFLVSVAIVGEDGGFMW